MSLSDRRKILGLGAAAALASCGFAPAFGPQGAAQGLLGKVHVDDPTDKNSFDLVARLEERLGRPNGATYRLSYSLATSNIGLGITSSNAITRYNISGIAGYALRRIGEEKVIAQGKVQNFTSYSASGTVVSTAASERDANIRLMRILADQIVTDLIGSSADWAER
ncbi:MAG: LPS assembly lipoprotein LptE [Albidovulum sp.]